MPAPEHTEGGGEARTVGIVAMFAMVGVALVLSAGALIMAAGGSGDQPVAATPAAAAASDADVPAVAAVELTEMDIGPDTIEIAAGGTLEVTNAGTAPHDLVIEGTDLATPMLDPGGTATLELGDLAPGTYTVFCSVPGHRAAGMEATLIVGDAADAQAASAADNDSGTDQGADAVVFDPNAAPEEGFEARDARLTPAPDTNVHDIEVRVTEVMGEVAPGASQELWTFNGTVPGPVIRGKVGDTFRVRFINDASMPHSIDFHASKVAPNDEMRTIDPGEELLYEFEAEHAGIWMYHCGTAPVLHHTGNGQYGAVIIDPPDLPEVDHEYVFVQSEFYLGPEGEVGDYDKMLAEEFDVVAFNGYASQYTHDPIDDVEVGERVRAWVLDAGPSENSSFHVIGTIFDTVYKEGAYRLQPGAGSEGGAQALDLQPAQGGFVEFTFDEDGVYPFVTHKFANVPRGGVGVFSVGDVAADASH